MLMRRTACVVVPCPGIEANADRTTLGHGSLQLSQILGGKVHEWLSQGWQREVNKLLTSNLLRAASSIARFRGPLVTIWVWVSLPTSTRMGAHVCHSPAELGHREVVGVALPLGTSRARVRAIVAYYGGTGLTSWISCW